MKVLRASDYLLRDFQQPNGQAANFYVGYYASQREGASYHSPLNCLPGSGWTLTQPDKVTISLPDGRSFAANKWVIQNGDYKSLMIYWYQGRGRAVASEYWGKVYTVIDSVRLRRSDGAMVRVTVPLGSSETAALDSAKDLSAKAAAALDEYVPN
jgi:EpsI family protein